MKKKQHGYPVMAIVWHMLRVWGFAAIFMTTNFHMQSDVFAVVSFFVMLLASAASWGRVERRKNNPPRNVNDQYFMERRRR